MKLALMILVFGNLFAATQVFAVGKVETIQMLIQEECQQKVSHQEALQKVRPLFLSCVPGTKVNVSEECELKCLKVEATGVAVGR